MIFRKAIIAATLLATCAAPVAAQDAPAQVLAPASIQPERIVLNLTADTAHEMAITWRSAPGLAGLVQYARATPGPDFVHNAETQEAITDNATFAVEEDPAFSAA